MKLSISRAAMAVALSLGVVGMAGAVAEPAYAAKKQKSQGDFSKEFVEAYQPVAEQMEADPAAGKAGIPALLAVVNSPDEKLAAGQVIYNIGAKTQDYDTQYQGVKLMIESGKVAAEQQPMILLAGGQLAYNAKDFPAAQTYLEQAATLSPTNAQIPAILAETYAQQGNNEQALDMLAKAIDMKKAAGEPVTDKEVFRGLAIAANNGLTDQASAWAVRVLQSNPSDQYRGEAYKVFSALSNFTKDQELDLLRLMARDGGLTLRQQYMAYLQAADARRRPAEVQNVIEMGIASGVLEGSGLANDELTLAKGRYAQTLKELNTDAGRAASADEAMAIADVYLGYDKGAEAEALYAKAISMGIANKDAALTGLGMAQVQQGKYVEAKATFDQIVVGNRGNLARLWSAYVDSQM